MLYHSDGTARIIAGQVGKSQVAAAPWPLGQPRGKDCQPRRRACIADDDQLISFFVRGRRRPESRPTVSGLVIRRNHLTDSGIRALIASENDGAADRLRPPVAKSAIFSPSWLSTRR